jgi:hypothetical protein
MWNTVSEDESVQVVGLVLETTSKCSGTDYFNVIAILVFSTANRVIGTPCRDKGARKRETSFV